MARRTEVLDHEVVDQLVAIDGNGEALCDVGALFVRDVPKQVEALAVALAGRDLQGVRSSAHTVRGSAATFGARHLASLAAGIEHEASKGLLPDGDDVAQLRASLEVAIAALVEIMERHQTALPPPVAALA